MQHNAQQELKGKNLAEDIDKILEENDVNMEEYEQKQQLRSINSYMEPKEIKEIVNEHIQTN